MRWPSAGFSGSLEAPVGVSGRGRSPCGVTGSEGVGIAGRDSRVCTLEWDPLGQSRPKGTPGRNRCQRASPLTRLHLRATFPSLGPPDEWRLSRPVRRGFYCERRKETECQTPVLQRSETDRPKSGTTGIARSGPRFVPPSRRCEPPVQRLRLKKHSEPPSVFLIEPRRSVWCIQAPPPG